MNKPSSFKIDSFKFLQSWFDCLKDGQNWDAFVLSCSTWLIKDNEGYEVPAKYKNGEAEKRGQIPFNYLVSEKLMVKCNSMLKAKKIGEDVPRPKGWRNRIGTGVSNKPVYEDWRAKFSAFVIKDD